MQVFFCFVLSVFDCSSSFSSLCHIVASHQHCIYSWHSFNEWSNHSAIKCKQPHILSDETLPQFACSAIRLFRVVGVSEMTFSTFVTCFSDFVKPGTFQRTKRCSLWIIVMFFSPTCFIHRLYFRWISAASLHDKLGDSRLFTLSDFLLIFKIKKTTTSTNWEGITFLRHNTSART